MGANVLGVVARHFWVGYGDNKMTALIDCVTQYIKNTLVYKNYKTFYVINLTTFESPCVLLAQVRYCSLSLVKCSHETAPCILMV